MISAVEQIEKTEGGYRIHAGEKIYETRCVVNAAGVYADVFHNMVSAKKDPYYTTEGRVLSAGQKSGHNRTPYDLSDTGSIRERSPGDTYYSRQSPGGSDGCGY